MQKLNIVFLDIDGVLNVQGKTQKVPGWNHAGIEPGLIKNLSELCKEVDAKVILVSSWKMFYIHRYFSLPGNYLHNIFKKYKIDCVDVIPMANTRGEAVKLAIENIEENKLGYKLDKFIILDDEHWQGYIENNFEKNLIKIDSSKGFDNNYLDQALDMMR